MSITFSEAMDRRGAWYDINCAGTGQHSSATVASSNGFKTFAITPNLSSFQFGELCTVTIFKDQVRDQDLDDTTAGTDTLPDNCWSFQVVAAGAPAPYPPSVHLDMGNPSSAIADLLQANNYLMEKPGFSLSYNRDLLPQTGLAGTSIHRGSAHFPL